MAVENSRFFQWIHGDKRGDIQIFDKIEEEDNNIYICFKGGSRINEIFVAPLNQQDLTGKLMAEIDHPSNFWKFQEEIVGQEDEKWETNANGENVCVQPYVPGKRVARAIPPRPSGPRSSNFGMISTPPAPPVVVEVEKFKINVDESDPVFILMQKSKKIDQEIEMTLVVAMPPKNLYNIAKESFELGAQKTVEYILKNIEIKDIKEALKTAITNMYESSDKETLT